MPVPGTKETLMYIQPFAGMRIPHLNLLPSGIMIADMFLVLSEHNKFIDPSTIKLEGQVKDDFLLLPGKR